MKFKLDMSYIKSKLQIFLYNFSWSGWVKFIDGWIPKFAFFIPFIGYLILFNDKISAILVFENLTNAEIIKTGLSAEVRLKLLYFGLIILGLSNFIYRMRRPYQFRFGDNHIDYTRTCLEIYTLSDYENIHGKLRQEDPFTPKGKYYHSNWKGFLEAANNTGEGTDEVERDGNWELAKSQYGGLLRDMLYENFFRNDVENRVSLTACIILSTFGYLLLIIPSIDIFIKVLRSTFPS
jgi:hypothetical protein